MKPPAAHSPVLVQEALALLSPALRGQAVLVDCTVGAGGHCEAFAKALPHLTVLGLDQDAHALALAAQRLAGFGQRIRLMPANFADIDAAVAAAGHGSVSAVFYDLGVSSMQLDQADRGFSFRSESALDMRMDMSAVKKASDVVNNYSEVELSTLISRYGEERFARRIARAIVRRRAIRPFDRADDLAEVVKAAIPAATRRTGSHPARRTFQALRIEVNAELDNLSASLEKAVELLQPGGRIAAVSYHSLEDRIVKSSFARYAKGCICPKDLPVCRCGREADLRILTSKPVQPSAAETSSNPRAGSARMRAAEKLGEAA